MRIFPFACRGFSILVIFCFVDSDAPAQTVAHRQAVDEFRGQTTLPVDALALEKAGPYTTMCVRSCDGFYFPLHQREHPQNFPRDAKSCSSECGSEARLFYFPFHTGKPATMIDLAGRKYADEPYAFAFRRSIVQGCACRPAPWSREAAARHQKYLVEANEKRSRREAATAPQSSAALSGASARVYYESDARAQKAFR
jgi:hypothetical protein